MSIDNQDRLDLIRYRLAEAKDTEADDFSQRFVDTNY